MPFHEFMDVRVTVNGLPLQEFPDPDGEEASGEQIVRYIEAIVGERFEVSIRWCPGFQLMNALNLVHYVHLDGQKWTPEQPTERRGLLSTNNILNSEKSYVYGNGVAGIGQGQIKTIHYTFGALGISESAEMDSSLDMDKIKNLGEIKVNIYRGGKVKLGNERPIRDLNGALEEVPEKLLKGRQLKNNVRYDTSEPSTHTTVRSWTCDPVGGQAGRVSVFVFKYRSRKILQRLGCIPRSPSPPPDYALISERQEALIREAKEEKRRANLENLRLKQRIEQLEGSRSTTVEPRGVKREREDDEDLEEIAPPPKKPSTLIDLTEDD